MSRYLYTSLVIVLLSAGCAVGPDYVKPTLVTVLSYSEKNPWKVVAPKDNLPKEGWWLVFNDTTLNQLEKQAVASNASLEAAYARLMQARAIARVSAANLGPSLSIQSSGGKTSYSANRQVPPKSTAYSYTTNSYDLPLDFSYEVDLFGKVRRSVESSQALAEATEASYNNFLLSLEAEVAENYYSLRSYETEKKLLQSAVEDRRQELNLIEIRKEGGASTDLELYQARIQLDTALAAQITLNQHSAILRHALATLVNKTADSFTIEIAPLTQEPPAIPVGLSSELIERRPDLAQAERQLASASAQIGVAKAAFFPAIKLTASAGYNSVAFSNLLKNSSQESSLIPFISLPVFNEGQNRANYESSKQAYNEARASYKQKLLTAFEDVENSLSDIRYLSEQSSILRDSVDASRKAAELSLLRYKEGVANYFEVVDADRTTLQNQMTDTQLEGQRFIASIHLIKALGGGW